MNEKLQANYVIFGCKSGLQIETKPSYKKLQGKLYSSR